MMNEEKMERLLKMAEHPELFSDSEMEQLMGDEECRQYYELTVMAEEGYLQRKDKDNEQPALADSPVHKGSGWAWHKTAAAVVGILMMAGIAFAAIRLTTARRNGVPATEQTTAKTIGSVQGKKAPGVKLGEKTQEPAIPCMFEDVELEKILAEMGKFYQMKVVFRNEESRKLRLFFKWEKNRNVEEVLEDLNHFDHVNISIEDRTLIVE
ncbi:MAG: DUF4974 domain-containing protein [Prevotella sp.]|nr:DUF4974 domain-containing protein [Prevotella sp.]